MSDPIELVKEPPRRHPDWIRVRAPYGENYTHLKSLVRGLRLHTVCEEALCPNIGECWGAGTLTVMILGEVCTRACRFCAVTTGSPRGVVDLEEPRRVAEAIAELGLTYVVITSVDRDDLPDEGAGIFAQTVREIKERSPQTIVEVLTPDFSGRADLMQRVVEAGPDVVATNVETVRRLSPQVRDRRAGYEQTLTMLRAIKEMDPTRRTKSSIMLGLGESMDEVLATMRDLRAHEVDLLAIGQYLRPTNRKRHYPIAEYIAPEQFQMLRDEGMQMGFAYVASGPLVRSSYKAWEAAKIFGR